MAVNDAVGNEELKRKDFDPSLKPEGQNFLRSPVTCLSVRGLVVEELTVGNYRNQNLDLVSSPSKAKQGQWQYLYQLASGSRSKGSQGDLASTGKDQVLLRVREELVTMNSDPRSLKLLSSKLLDPAPKGVFAYMRASEDKIISSNSLSTTPARLKALSTSSFSQLFVKKSLAGKGSICGAPEACSGFGGAIGDQNDEKLHDVTKVASSALLKLSANNGQSSMHRINRSGPEPFNDGISLREWLKPGRSKLNKAESVLIFRQIVEIVDFAHSQGVVLNDLWPSCFFLLRSSRVKYTGSSTAVRELEGVMCQESYRKRPLEKEERAYLSLGAKQRRICEEMNSIKQQPYFMTNGGLSTKSMKETEISITGPEDSGHTELQSQNNSSCQNKYLATQQTIPITVHSYQNKSLAAQQYVSATVQSEEKWYTSPEDLNERGCTFSSNIYGLGVLFFELLCIFESSEAHSAVMLDLRHRILPPNFLSENPKEAGFCLWLLHPEPSSRPTTREILQSELIFGSQELHSGDDFSVSGSVEDGESKPLLHFLISLKEQKQNHASKLAEDIECLEEDIKLAERRHLIGTSTAFSWGQDEIPNVGKSGFHLLDAINPGVSSRSFSVSKLNEERLMRNISQLEDAYFSMRSEIQLRENAIAERSDKELLNNRERWTHVKNEHEKPSRNQKSIDRLGAFFEGLCKFCHYSKFEVCGTLRNGDLLNSANVTCSLSFDRDEDYLAAAGVSKKIKIFEFSALLDDSVDIHYPVVEMSNKSKLSCVCWNNYIKNYLASTDYDGVVQMWDAGTGQGFSQYMEHQKRAWSVDFSQSDPTKFASGSDDCSVKLWSINEQDSIVTIWNPANVCCVQFSAYSTHLLAFGSADYKIYCYDLRHTRIPWCTLADHGKAVSYVKFLDSETLVSASTDNTLKLWDLNKTSSIGLSSTACSLTFVGHTNEKNFVGLSVLDGYIVCGSETNEVYSYYRSLPMPITSYKFGSTDPVSGNDIGDDKGQFVSSVCWGKKSNVVVAANSSGSMKLLQMKLASVEG
ncbi:hypothetical protein CMV_009132 [Castanea mollissima]|uniref:Protein kinase domain-containing protein n=2 Tax=Castanea mollissima TaxID=60419 RepID=A0A8J4RIH2_9ROSI|nr:hypothetical protein CMV_009132 [Castanea mollissima]